MLARFPAWWYYNSLLWLSHGIKLESMQLSQTLFAICFNQMKLKPNIIYLWGYPVARSESFPAPLDKLNCLLVAIPDAVMLSPAYARSYT